MEKILVIDDSLDTQAIITEVFAGNYALDFRNDGLAGVAAAQENAPDLILLDVHMPKMDGYQACRILKSGEGTREIPVLFITVNDSEGERVMGFEAGAEDYVVKPFYREELLARVKVHLALRKARTQALELERLKVFKEMAVAVSHEINNPLTSVYAFLYVLQRELAGSPEIVATSLAGIQKDVTRIQDIANNLARATTAASTPYNRNITMIDLHNI
jgi:DNA-binding response OmpR family regulator